MKRKHFFGCKIGKFSENWTHFQVECGRMIERENVTDERTHVTCGNCLRLIK